AVLEAEQDHALTRGGRSLEVAAVQLEAVRGRQEHLFGIWSRLADGHDEERLFLENAADEGHVFLEYVDVQQQAQAQEYQERDQQGPEPDHRGDSEEKRQAAGPSSRARASVGRVSHSLKRLTINDTFCPPKPKLL